MIAKKLQGLFCKTGVSIFVHKYEANVRHSVGDSARLNVEAPISGVNSYGGLFSLVSGRSGDYLHRGVAI